MTNITKNSLSVVVSAYNEEKKIKACLESVKWADEIIFLDNSSTDKTAEIAKQYTQNVYTQKNDPLSIDLLKNSGIEKATGDWILILDADERVTQELKEEIKSGIMDYESGINGYWIPRKNIIFRKWIQHSGWYPDEQLRFFRKGKGKFTRRHVHEPLAVEGETARLKEHLLHENYDTISQFLHKHITVYAPNEAQNKLEKGYKFDWRDAIRFPLSEFLSRYFAREGYKDGFHGLMLSLLMSVYHLIIFAYIWEKKDFPSLQSDLKNEFRYVRREVNFWVYNEKIKSERNLFKKLILKCERKLKEL